MKRFLIGLAALSVAASITPTAKAFQCPIGVVNSASGGGGDDSLEDDESLTFGNGDDCWFIYDSGNTQFELNSTDVDGIGTNGVVFYVDDGTDDLVCTGNVTTPTITATTSFVGGDDVPINQGAGTDYWWIYDSGNTQYELNATNVDGVGSDGVVFYVDDGTDDLVCTGNLTATNITATGYIDLGTTSLYLNQSADADTLINTTGADSVNIQVGGDVLLLAETGGYTTISGEFILQMQDDPEYGADSGDGNPGTITITPATGYCRINCQDADGCTATMGEGGTVGQGALVMIVNDNVNPAYFSDTSGVSELAGSFTMDQYDSLLLMYQDDRWVELARSRNSDDTVTFYGLTNHNIPTTMTPTGVVQTVDWADGNIQKLDLESATGDVTVSWSNNTAGARLTLWIIQDSGGAHRDIVWPASVWWQGGAPPVITAVNDAVDVVECITDGTNEVCDAGQDYQ